MKEYYTYNYATHELDKISAPAAASNHSYYDKDVDTVKAESIEEANKIYIEKQLRHIKSFSLNKNILFVIQDSMCLYAYIDGHFNGSIRMLKGRQTISSIKNYLEQLGLIYDKRFEPLKIMYSQLNPSIFRIEVTKNKIYFMNYCYVKRENFTKEIFPEFQKQYKEALETYEEEELKKKINFAKKYKDAKKIIEKYNNLSDEEKLQIELLENEKEK